MSGLASILHWTSGLGIVSFPFTGGGLRPQTHASTVGMQKWGNDGKLICTNSMQKELLKGT